MGEWADYDFDFDRVDFKYARDVQNSNWLQKNGEIIKIGDMTDKHLLNAYKVSDSDNVFREMVVRLFTARVEQVERTARVEHAESKRMESLRSRK